MALRRIALTAALLALASTALAAETFTASDGAKITYTPAPVVTPPPVTTPPATGVVYGFHAGQKLWAGDYSYAASINYQDASGAIAVKSDPYGAWQPFMCSGVKIPLAGCKALWVYSTSGFTKLTFKLKPTQPNQVWQVQFIGVGDVALPYSCTVQVTPKYGPAAQVGAWATYTIPLADLCVAGKDVYKFAIQDQSGRSGNTWYVDDAGFAP